MMGECSARNMYGRCPFCTADLDLAHTSPSHTNDLYSYTIPACTVEAPDVG
jgi:hypothetical protein